MEPLHIDLTALVEGWGYYLSFGNEIDIDGIEPSLAKAIQKVLDRSYETAHTPVTPPTCEEMWEDDCSMSIMKKFALVHTTKEWCPIKVDSDAYKIHDTFIRGNDNTYWTVSYILSDDDDINEFRSGEATILRVHPKLSIVTSYEHV